VPRIIGIDLGTTNSCVAVVDRGLARVLAGADGERTIPSMVSFAADGSVLVGAAARRQLVTNPTGTVYGTKRLIGRKVSSPDVDRLRSSAPFALVPAPNGDAWLHVPERDVSPQEIAAHVIERLRRIAEDALGEPVTQAVITVPAYFNDAQRQATKDAGRIAGLEVRRILNEPTAAALAYGIHRRRERQTIAVVDLGGGTFDVSILSVDRGLFEVLAVSGDTALGGDDFDRRIVEKVVLELEQKTGVALSNDPVVRGRLKDEAEKAKKILSAETRTTLALPFLGRTAAGDPIHLERALSREELESLTADLVTRMEAPCRQALKDAKLEPTEVGQVLLVGGMTRMPAVQALVERLFGRRPSKGANPDEVVALGAAAHAAILTGEIEDIILLDVTPHPLGIRVEGQFITLLPRNTTVPARARKMFATTHDNQPHVSVEVVQGTGADERSLGRFTLDGLPRGPAGSVRVELTFSVDADGILHVAAREITTGRAAALTISPAGGLSEEDIARIIEARRRQMLR
jgi:molecular chaperone DnaK